MNVQSRCSPKGWSPKSAQNQYWTESSFKMAARGDGCLPLLCKDLTPTEMEVKLLYNEYCKSGSEGLHYGSNRSNEIRCATLSFPVVRNSLHSFY